MLIGHVREARTCRLMCIIMVRAPGLEDCHATIRSWLSQERTGAGADTGAFHLHVKPMADSDVEALVSQQLRGKKLPPEVLEYIWVGSYRSSNSLTQIK